MHLDPAAVEASPPNLWTPHPFGGPPPLQPRGGCPTPQPAEAACSEPPSARTFRLCSDSFVTLQPTCRPASHPQVVFISEPLQGLRWRQPISHALAPVVCEGQVTGLGPVFQSLEAAGKIKACFHGVAGRLWPSGSQPRKLESQVPSGTWASVPSSTV